MELQKDATQTLTLTWRDRLRWFWKEWAKPILVILLIVGSFRSAVADWNDVPSGSMKPTILEGDRIFVNKLAYSLRIPFTSIRLASLGDPKRGDVIVFFPPAIDKLYVKRVVGIPGDVVELRDNRVILNGKPLDYEASPEHYELEIVPDERQWHEFQAERLGDHVHPIMLNQTLWSRNFGPTTVPPGQYFVMGDNRDSSSDSRVFGMVDRGQIMGRATAVAVSVDPDRWFSPRWHRFFQPLP